MQIQIFFGEFICQAVPIVAIVAEPNDDACLKLVLLFLCHFSFAFQCVIYIHNSIAVAVMASAISKVFSELIEIETSHHRLFLCRKNRVVSAVCKLRAETAHAGYDLVISHSHSEVNLQRSSVRHTRLSPQCRMRRGRCSPLARHFP